MHIDCSHGEGGGQVLRMSLSLSAACGIPVSLDNIRAGRTTPGLRPQHKAVVSALSAVCGASVSGYDIGSRSIAFSPSRLTPGTYGSDIGTAGSASLLCHALLVPLSRAGGVSHVDVVGGTDVPWSPTIDYFSHVTIPFLSLMGIRATVSCAQRGYYPRGGGVVSMDVYPWDERHGAGTLTYREPDTICISSCSAGLPERVAVEQADAAASAFPDCDTDIIVDRCGRGRGSSITLWAMAGDIPVGASRIGKRGLCARDVGAQAASDLTGTLAAGAADHYLPDQAVSFMALSGGLTRIPLSRVTSHLETVLWVTKQFIPCGASLHGGMLSIWPE